MAIASSMLVACAAVLFLTPVLSETSNITWTQITTVLILSAAMGGVGVADDLYRLPASVKLLCQLGAAIAACALGIRIETIGAMGVIEWHLGWMSWPITMLWIVGITNAINLIDGLDGLAAGISIITCAVVAIFSFYTNQVVMVVLMLAMIGSLAGFLFYNFNPAKIFMGDSGTLFLGFFLATAGIMCAAKAQTIVALAMVAMSLGLPLFDTFFSILRRTVIGRSMLAPDRGHVHHQLLAMGLSQRRAVLLLYLVTLLAGGMGATMMFLRRASAVAVFLAVGLALVFVFRATGTMRFREYLKKLQRQVNSAVLEGGRRRKLDHLRLRIREARDLRQWWRCVRLAAREIGLAGLRIRRPSSQIDDQELHWFRDLGRDDLTRIEFPLSDRYGSWGGVQMDVYLDADVSIELAGRIVAMFGSVLEEYVPTSAKLSDELTPSPVLSQQDSI
ncbi:MAG: MraY family glycosyltransferase [Planctomycetota bacterium]